MTRTSFRLVVPAIVGALIACSGAGDVDLFGQPGDGGVTGNDGPSDNDGSAEEDAFGEDAPTPDGGPKKDASGGKDANGIPDAKPDSPAPCNQTAIGAVAVAAGCNNAVYTYGGGKFTSGHYELDQVTILAGKATCNSLPAVTHKGALDLVADASGDNATMELVFETNGTIDRRTLVLASPGLQLKTEVKMTCPVVATTTWDYDTFGNGGKQLRFQAPYGAGGLQAAYSFTRP